jgi:hypothetical protein
MYTLSLVCVLIFIVHISLKLKYGEMKDGLDAVSLGLISVGLSPWIARVLESFKLGGVEFKFVKQALEKQSDEINSIKFIISSLVAKYELEHLKKLASGNEFIIHKDRFPEHFQREIRHLRDLGLVDNYPGKGVGVMYNDSNPHKNLREHFHITERGKTYLKLRAEVDDKNTKSPV